MSAAPKLEAVERRRAERFPAYKTVLVHAGDSPAIACLIENVSEHGALLRFTEPVKLPPRFKVTSPDDQVTLNCRRKRVSDRSVAVEFIRA